MNEETQKILSKLAHDINNPVAAMKLYLEMLLSEVPGPLTDKQKDMLKEIQASNERILALLSDVRAQPQNSL